MAPDRLRAVTGPEVKMKANMEVFMTGAPGFIGRALKRPADRWPRSEGLLRDGEERGR